jgi:hypothetical protein
MTEMSYRETHFNLAFFPSVLRPSAVDLFAATVMLETLTATLTLFEIVDVL